jgi:hypothetical protein
MAEDIYPPDYASDIGKVRALIPDVEQVDFNDDGTAGYLFSDAHLGALLATFASRGSAVLRAAAAAMRALAVSEGLIQKVVRTEDLQTDGAKLAAALLKAAKDLDDRADDEEDDEGYAMAIVDFQPYPCDPLPYSLRGFPEMCCLGSRAGNCGCAQASGAPA